MFCTHDLRAVYAQQASGRVPPNGLRYRRGGLAKLLNIIAPNLTNYAANLGAIAPSGARFVSPLFAKRLALY